MTTKAKQAAEAVDTLREAMLDHVRAMLECERIGPYRSVDGESPGRWSEHSLAEENFRTTAAAFEAAFTQALATATGETP